MEIEKYRIGVVYNKDDQEIDRVQLPDAGKFDYKKYTEQMPITVKWYTCAITHEPEDIIHYDRPGKEAK